MTFLAYVVPADRCRIDDGPVKGTLSELGLKANLDSEPHANGVCRLSTRIWYVVNLGLGLTLGKLEACGHRLSNEPEVEIKGAWELFRA